MTSLLIIGVVALALAQMIKKFCFNYLTKRINKNKRMSIKDKQKLTGFLRIINGQLDLH